MRGLKVLLVLASFLAFAYAFPVVIVDSKGYKVTLDKKPKRIVVAGGMWPLPALLIALGQDAKSLVYVPKASISALTNSILYKFYPDIKDIKSSNSDNIETLLSYKPDLFICHTANDKLCNMMKETTVPTIMLDSNPYPHNYDSLNSLKAWLAVSGKILDKEKLSSDILKDTIQTRDFIAKRLKGIKPKKALIIHRFNQGEGLAVGGLFANYWLSNSGGLNVYKNLKGTKNVNLEDLYSKDIDVIFITNFNTLTPKDLESNKDYQFIKAVKNKQVYKFPLFTYRPFAPSLDASLLLLFIAKTLHPMVFKDIDLNEKIKTHFKKFYNLDVSSKDIDSMLSPNPKAGLIK
ncbi:ABC transporter substrate-binding protein [Helicobacter sp. 11S02629-2]|uniref:ABC transporter substrate-binding protein n=1 Tax=Helicobacter sp. 11S02629-2 TaxID=1476195 RepID=UPI000BA68646|nr:ABC transporter substrate-binding protein [Helicobacter sp. 11S02629-2]PAF45557.1 hypothetical protein BKH40_01355 [Helicobacter sp. 11S02629-2]